MIVERCGDGELPGRGIQERLGIEQSALRSSEPVLARRKGTSMQLHINRTLPELDRMEPAPLTLGHGTARYTVNSPLPRARLRAVFQTVDSASRWYNVRRSIMGLRFAF